MHASYCDPHPPPATQGGITALNPETGTASEGDTIEQALANLREAVELYLEEFPLQVTSAPFVTTSPWQSMPDYPVLSGAEIVRALERLGFSQVRQRGSHAVLRRGQTGCVVPSTAR